MRHAGDEDSLRQASRPVPPPLPDPLAVPLPGPAAAQSTASICVATGFGLLLVAVVADAPVRALAQSLDPTLRDTLRWVTEFGKSSWPLGIGLALLGVVWFLRRRRSTLPAADLAALRSAFLFVVLAVAGSGFLASLSKHMIGRIRPSTEADAQVLEFSVMAFRSGWASFPSGHATTATAMALALAWCFPRFAWAWLAFGVSIALSRAFLGVHWLTDCLAGVLLGTVVTVAIHRAMVARGHRLQPPPGALGRALAEALWQAPQAARDLVRILRRRAGA
jgi:MYXO-CTERM domain-containing protein